MIVRALARTSEGHRRLPVLSVLPHAELARESGPRCRRRTRLWWSGSTRLASAPRTCPGQQAVGGRAGVRPRRAPVT
jgi:hypothetical protein